MSDHARKERSHAGSTPSATTDAPTPAKDEAVLWRCDTCGDWLAEPTFNCVCAVVDKRPIRYFAVRADAAASRAPLRSEDDWQTLQAAIVTQSDLIKRLTSAASGPQQETGPQEWQAAFERLGHVLNIEAREHGEIVKALEVEYDMGSMESDETFHARVLDRIAQLRAASLGVSPTAEKGKELARVREKIMGVVCLSEGADIKNVSLNFSTDEWRQLSAALTSAASRPTS